MSVALRAHFLSSFLHFVRLRDLCSSYRSPRSSTMETEQEKVTRRKGLSADATLYRCAACHGDEDWVLGAPIRGRAKARSLSASPALASTKEFRYEGLSACRCRGRGFQSGVATGLLCKWPALLTSLAQDAWPAGSGLGVGSVSAETAGMSIAPETGHI